MAETGSSIVKRISVTSIEAREMDVYARLTERQLRGAFAPSEGLFVAESSKVIGRALDAGYLPVSLLIEERLVNSREAEELAVRCAHVPVYTAPLSVMEQITGYKLTKGILCALRRCPLPAMEKLLQNARRITVLENVMNPTNLGAIFRSAAALGIDAVLLSPGCADPLYRRASRVSMGTVFQVPWTVVPEETLWPAQSLRFLKEMGFITAAMALRRETLCLDDPLLREADKLAVLLGAEGDGLTEETIALCDYTIKIPMASGVDSLNVAAASAVAFWELRTR